MNVSFRQWSISRQNIGLPARFQPSIVETEAQIFLSISSCDVNFSTHNPESLMTLDHWSLNQYIDQDRFIVLPLVAEGVRILLLMFFCVFVLISSLYLQVLLNCYCTVTCYCSLSFP